MSEEKIIPKIIIKKDGPYIVAGNIPISKEISIPDEKDELEKWKKTKEFPEKKTSVLCRCGESDDKPYCDNTHKKTGFNGKETASNKKYLDQSETIKGPEIDLTDAGDYCSGARFCHRAKGTWYNTRKSDKPESKKVAIETACNCPSGRLVVWDKKTGEPIEPDLKPGISILEDPQKKVSGPIWVKGCIDIESEDGTKYENRNRVTLCRCGKSDNKPFCDGSHIDSGFNDGDESLL